MKSVHKSVLIWYSPAEMYALVTDVARYPEFLPWCSHTQVLEQDASGMTAEYGQQLVDFMYGPLALVALAVAVIGPLVGGLLGERVFKKHFARMGA